MIQEADEINIRKYLLGKLSEEEQAQVEERLMAEDDYFDLLEAVEDDLIDDRLSNELTREEQERFDAHFLSTSERREKLKFAETLNEYPIPTPDPSPKPSPAKYALVLLNPTWWRHIFSNPYLRGAAAAIIIIGIGFALRPIIVPTQEVSKGIIALNKAFHQQRPTQARITEFDYAPFPPTTRGGEEEKVDTVSLNHAERILLDEVAERPGARSYHALGRLYLAERKLDEAIEQFDRALKLDEKNAQIESDLGAALLEKGKVERSNGESGKSFDDFARSRDHLTKALELDGSLLEARFNRAILYQYMTLLDQAEEDWRKYIERDPNSKWAEEAKHKLKELEERKTFRSQNRSDILLNFVGAYRSGDADKAYELMSQNTEAITGQLVWWQLLEAYLDLSLKDQSYGASQYLKALTYAGKLQEQKMGDQFISDLAQFYGASTFECQTDISRAHALINEAHTLLARSEIDQAIGRYEKAKDLFDKTGNQLESQFADYYIGYCLYRKSEFKKSLSALSEVAEYSKARDYLWLLECSLMMIANIQGESNQFSTSLACYKESLEISKRINDEYNIQRNLTSLAYGYKNLGDREESLAYMQRCLERAGNHWPGARQMYRNFDTAAGILNSFGYYAAAAEYEKAALQQALEAKDPVFQHRSYTHLGSIYSKLQDYTEALKWTEQGYQVAKAMSGERRDSRSLALSYLQLGHIYRQAQAFDDAAAYYDKAVTLFKDMNLYAFLYETHKGKLLCYIDQGNDSLAEQELQTVLAFFEEHRSKIREEKNRNSFFDLEQYVYDIAIDFQYSKKHNYQKAFEYSEMSRARSLFDMMNAGTEIVGKNSMEATIPVVTQPLMLDSIRERMSGQVQILQYSALDDKLLIWVITRKKFEMAEAKITSSSLTEKVFSYWQSISNLSENGTEESRRKAIELYEILVRPVEPLLEKDKQICVVPDKALNYLPFNALISPDTNRYLINDYLLSFAASANTFLFCSKKAGERSATTNEKALCVGDPHFNRDAFPRLANLPSSGKEAEEVSRCYKPNCCLVGELARKARVRTEMAKAHVIHFASHYDIDESNPMLSKLLLTANSKDQSSEDFLQGYEIYQKKLPVTRLVTLAACRTGIEQYYKGEGMIGMSRTFLAAGVPLVVASLWPADSDSTANLMISFHKYRTSGRLSSAQALRQAQLDMIGHAPSQYSAPYYWAPFIVIGGYANF